MKPHIHSQNSAKEFGGKPEDYIAIHNFLDSSKSGIATKVHRALTHNTWFIAPDGPLEKAFGVVITNSDGKEVSVRDIGEQHILEDFGGKFIPTVQDWLSNLVIQEWMDNGKTAVPPEPLPATTVHPWIDPTTIPWIDPNIIYDGMIKQPMVSD